MITQPWRLEIRHTTRFEYAQPARASYNEARMIPLTTIRQTTMAAQIVTRPAARQYRYWDYWGTQVVAFDVPEAHRELEIEATGVVDTGAAAEPAPIGWDELSDRADAMAELLAPTAYTSLDADLAERAAELRGPTPAGTVEAVTEWVHGALEYEPGVTGVHTSAVDAVSAGKGVCQDFAHLGVGMLRELGIPARYVSGYLHPSPDPVVDEEVAGQSHAWVEAWTGDWRELDPTNLVTVGPRHVAVARARDYADVTPVKGVYAGGGEDTMTVAVRIRRIRRD